jgi:hypothetical protein
MDYISKDNAHEPIIGKMQTLGLLTADNLAVRPCTITGLQKGTDHVKKIGGKQTE